MIVLDHIGLNVKDLEESIDFYRQWFGFELFHRWESPRQAFIGNSRLILGIMENPEFDFQRHTMAHLAFSIEADEFSQWVEKIAAAQLTVVTGPKPQRDGETILFRDPSGNILEICYPPLGSCQSPRG